MATLDLTGGKLDIKCRAGDDPGFTLPTASDLTGWVWSGQIRSIPDGELVGAFDFDVSAQAASCRIHHDVTRALDPAQAPPLLSTRVAYDIQVVSDTGLVTTLLSGTITVFPDVTV